MIFRIKNEELMELNGSRALSFPKYTSQLINWANQNAQGTRPRAVGQLSELFPEYQKDVDSVTLEGWEKWYLDRYPNAINDAADKIFHQIENLKEAIQLIDEEMVREWVRDLIITKTYNGLYVQQAILTRLAGQRGLPCRLARPDEESLGIDGYVGDVAYSIKPNTYKTMGRLSETIPVKMIYYTKTKNGLTIEVEE